jgi:membrane associated rhomboid family serine protease
MMNHDAEASYYRQKDPSGIINTSFPLQDHSSSNTRAEKTSTCASSMNHEEMDMEKQCHLTSSQNRSINISGEVRLVDVYEYRQAYGYLSILVSVIQTILLILLMVKCGIAPPRINPMIGPYPDALSHWGAKNAVLILEEGETWRLISPLWVHAGILHLVGNISAQLETGLLCEREWGSVVWLWVYILSTLGATIISTCLLPDVLSVGSSGAIMGIFGAKIAEIICRSHESRITVQQKVGHAIRKHQLAEALGGAIIVMLFSFIPFVDWASHLGGLVTGLFVGLMIFSSYIQNPLWRRVGFIMGAILTVSLLATSLIYMYTQVHPADRLRDVCGYYQQFFAGYECSCSA